MIKWKNNLDLDMHMCEPIRYDSSVDREKKSHNLVIIHQSKTSPAHLAHYLNQPNSASIADFGRFRVILC
jgi:hypothetical protein